MTSPFCYKIDLCSESIISTRRQFIHKINALTSCGLPPFSGGFDIIIIPFSVIKIAATQGGRPLRYSMLITAQPISSGVEIINSHPSSIDTAIELGMRNVHARNHENSNK